MSHCNRLSDLTVITFLLLRLIHDIFILNSSIMCIISLSSAKTDLKLLQLKAELYFLPLFFMNTTALEFYQ